jgi:hypothetical protein
LTHGDEIYVLGGHRDLEAYWGLGRGLQGGPRSGFAALDTRNTATQAISGTGDDRASASHHAAFVHETVDRAHIVNGY